VVFFMSWPPTAWLYNSLIVLFCGLAAPEKINNSQRLSKLPLGVLGQADS
jgi:hypothetical protein